ncbi:hypothetical protein K438DRAFT_1764236 [Mycena galopus ATCC 62051]|nr:hypothetical protein K438DRAFT_1764236 [Mycena galopus ATCC 62051]
MLAVASSGAAGSRYGLSRSRNFAVVIGRHRLTAVLWLWSQDWGKNRPCPSELTITPRMQGLKAFVAKTIELHTGETAFFVAWTGLNASTGMHRSRKPVDHRLGKIKFSPPATRHHVPEGSNLEHESCSSLGHRPPTDHLTAMHEDVDIAASEERENQWK